MLKTLISLFLDATKISSPVDAQIKGKGDKAFGRGFEVDHTGDLRTMRRPFFPDISTGLRPTGCPRPFLPSCRSRRQEEGASR